MPHLAIAPFASTCYCTLDVYYVARQLAERHMLRSGSFVLLLNFAKGYDSLSRGHALRVGKNMVFSSSFRRTIERLHNGATARFHVNGYQSDAVHVTQGIRQGCPLAPLLFVLALDPLYAALERSTAIQGIEIAHGGACVNVGVAGYADDAALYLADAASIPAALESLEAFGRESGLVVNADKCVGVRLGSPLVNATTTSTPMMFLAGGASCRYIELRAGGTSAYDDN